MQLRTAVGFAAKSSYGADGEPRMPFNLRPISIRRIKLRREENRPQRFANVAIAPGKRSSHAFDKRRRWTIGNKVTHKLGGYESCRGRIVGKNVEHHQAVFESAPGGDLVAQDNFFAVIVSARIEEKVAGILAQYIRPWSVCHRLGDSGAAAGCEDSPARETTRNFLHIFLRVATVDT